MIRNQKFNLNELVIKSNYILSNLIWESKRCVLITSCIIKDILNYKDGNC